MADKEELCHCKVCAGSPKVPAKGTRPAAWKHELPASEVPPAETRKVPTLHRFGMRSAIEDFRSLAGTEDVENVAEYIPRPLNLTLKDRARMERAKLKPKPVPPPALKPVLPLYLMSKREKKPPKEVRKFNSVEEKIEWIKSRTDITPGLKTMQINNILRAKDKSK